MLVVRSALHRYLRTLCLGLMRHKSAYVIIQSWSLVLAKALVLLEDCWIVI